MSNPFVFNLSGNRTSIHKRNDGSVKLEFFHYSGMNSVRFFESQTEYTNWARKGGGWPELR